jgi:hypothetical protein
MQPYTANWPAIRPRLEAFWAREIIDRPVIQVIAPLPGEQPPLPEVSLEARWTDPGYRLTEYRQAHARAYYAGDAFPTFRPNLGPGFFAGILGAPVRYAPDTVWYDPCVTDLDSAPPAFDPAHPLWQTFARLMTAAADAAPGHFLLGQTDMVPSTDILATLLGPEALCVAMLEQPEAVARWLAALTDAFLAAYHAQAAMLPAGNGYTSWLTAWSETPSYALQNDFSCMISPDAFTRFCLPELEVLTAALDYSVYHLDGPGAIPHLDALLSLPRLHAIQWTPGAGQPPMSTWIPLLQQVQRAGKGLYLYCEPWEIPLLTGALRPEGVIYCTWTGSPEEAEALVQSVLL